MNETQVRAAKTIQRRTGRTFHLATRLLPRRIRRPTYVLYGFFRIADEVVDDPDGATPEEQVAALERLRAAATGETEAANPVVAAFRDVAEAHDIDDAEVHAFVDAMAADATRDRYETYEDLEAYMRGSAAAVGVMMTDLMAPAAYDRARPHAVALGEAFQLTNFVRDVREDATERSRVYLPASTLARHGVDTADVLALSDSPGLRAAVRAALRRAEHRYREGVAGIRYLPEDCQFAVLLAAVLYAEHHRLIRTRGFDVLTSAPSLSLGRSLALVARTGWHWRWNDDPEAVFRRVGAVPDGNARHEGVEHPRTLPVR